MKFLSILKAVGGVATTTAPMAGLLIGGPALSATLSTVIGAVVASERPDVAGEQKKTSAMQYVAVAAPGIVALIESSTGRQLIDEARFMRALGRMIDAAVDLLNAFGALKDGEGK
jgi:hypothetical protein